MKNIMIVDMQKGFIKKNNIHLVDKINEYLKNNKFDNVIFTKCINNSTSPFHQILNWNEMTKKEEQQIILNIPPKSIILNKNGHGLTPDNIKNLKNLNITEIEICGTDIDACCMAISFNLFDNNIKPIVLYDLCGSSSSNANIYDYSVQIIKRQFSNK